MRSKTCGVPSRTQDSRKLPIVHRSQFIKQFSGPGEDSKIVCFQFWQLVVAAGCPFRCSYCFLQAVPSYVFRRYPLQGAIFENWQDMLHEVQEWLNDSTPRTLLVGELQDGLAFESTYKKMMGKSLTQMLVPLFAAQDRHRLVFLTKSTAIQFTMELQPTPQVVFSWSINAEEAARRWEVGAPSPKRRLEAAGKMKSLGWPIRLRLDPMIPFEGWRDGYARVIELVNELEPEMVTLGALRASHTLQAHTRRNNRDASIFDLLSEEDPSHFKRRLPRELQIQMYRFALSRLGDSEAVLALCKEDVSLWKELGLEFRGCHCLSSSADQVVNQRIANLPELTSARTILSGVSSPSSVHA